MADSQPVDEPVGDEPMIMLLDAREEQSAERLETDGKMDYPFAVLAAEEDGMLSVMLMPGEKKDPSGQLFQYILLNKEGIEGLIEELICYQKNGNFTCQGIVETVPGISFPEGEKLSAEFLKDHG